MRITKALLFSVLHARGSGVPPLLGQRLPGEFDTDDYPDLLRDLGVRESDLTGSAAADAVELTRMDADPDGRLDGSGDIRQSRKRREQLAAEFRSPDHRG